MKPNLNPPRTTRKHLKLNCDVPLPTFAYNFHLRRYSKASSKDLNTLHMFDTCAVIGSSGSIKQQGGAPCYTDRPSVPAHNEKGVKMSRLFFLVFSGLTRVLTCLITGKPFPWEFRTLQFRNSEYITCESPR
jgi:hypothetical protein